MMEKNILGLAIIAILSMVSCKDKVGKMNMIESAEKVETTKSLDKITSIATNEAGEKLTMIFDASKGIAEVVWKQDTIVLKEEKTASGFWYKNDQFELRGKGEKVDFSKDARLVFKN